MRNAFTVITIASLVFIGCAKKEPVNNGQAAKSVPAESSIKTFVDGATGKTAVEAGKKAKQQINDIRVKQNNDLEDAMK